MSTANLPANLSTNLPYERFKRDATDAEKIEWIRTHRYVWYHAPMDMSPSRVEMTSKVRTWKRDKSRFEVSVIHYAGFDTLRWRIDNSHLDRICIPNQLWWHGITATVTHEYSLSNGYRGTSTLGHYRKYGMWDGCTSVPVTVVKKHVVVHQSNGYHLDMFGLDHAIRFCQSKNIRLTVTVGRRTRTLVKERADKGE